jgi:hypothetical protein
VIVAKWGARSIAQDYKCVRMFPEVSGSSKS